MKKIVAALLALVMLIACSSAALAAGYIPDVNDLQSITKQFAPDRCSTQLYTEDDGTKVVLVDYRPDSTQYYEVYAVVSMVGSNKNIVSFKLFTNYHVLQIPESDTARALAAVNQFNIDYRLPTAYFNTDNRTFCANSFLYLVDGTQGMVREFIENCFLAAENYLDALVDAGFYQFSTYTK